MFKMARMCYNNAKLAVGNPHGGGSARQAGPGKKQISPVIFQKKGKKKKVEKYI